MVKGEGRPKTREEIASLREGGRRLAAVLQQLTAAARPGVTTRQLDALAEELIVKSDGRPSFKGYQRFPACICISVNEEIVHAIPSDRSLVEGDVVGLDTGMWYDGLCTDHAVTIGIGRISRAAQRLIAVTRDSLAEGLRQVRAGARVGDVGSAIQAFIESRGFGVVRSLVGHGVGYEVHEAPAVPNFGKVGEGPSLPENLVIAIEPMVTMGDYQTRIAADGWTVVTRDGSLAAHFEHTLAVTREGCEVLTRV